MAGMHDRVDSRIAVFDIKETEIHDCLQSNYPSDPKSYNLPGDYINGNFSRVEHINKMNVIYQAKQFTHIFTLTMEAWQTACVWRLSNNTLNNKTKQVQLRLARRKPSRNIMLKVKHNGCSKNLFWFIPDMKHNMSHPH